MSSALMSVRAAATPWIQRAGFSPKRVARVVLMMIAISGFATAISLLKTAFHPKALADFRDLRFAPRERIPARMNGLVAEHELVRMLDRRAQDEARAFKGFKFEGPARRFEHGQLAPVHDLRRSEPSPVHGDPGDGVIFRRLVAPSLALLKRNVQ